MRVVLIGGSSHAGKSSLAESLAANLGWTHISTDSLARHAGRPWKPHPEKVPDDVAEHYLCLSVDELITDVLRHYRVNVWPKVEAIVASHTSATPNGSMYRSKSSREQTMVGKFLARTLAYDSRMVEVVNRHGLTLIDVSQSDVAQLTERCLEALSLRRR